MKRFLYSVLLFLFVFNCISQVKPDAELLLAHQTYEEKFEQKRKVEYLFKNKNAFVKYNPVSLFFGGALYLYQSTISKQIGAACPYEYHCSHFSKVCIRKYGLIKGILLTSDRLTRCTRLAVIDINENVDIRKRTSKIIDDPDEYSFKAHKH